MGRAWQDAGCEHAIKAEALLKEGVTDGSVEAKALVSIAFSLDRIADALEGTES